MSKRKPAFDPAQMNLDIPHRPLPSDGMLVGVDREFASAIARILKDDDRDRYDVAAAMSRHLEADISKSMLDKYSSESSEEHNISFGRTLALFAATGRFDILNAFLNKIGCGLYVGEEVLTVELGHAIAEKEQLEARIRQLKKAAPAIRRGGRN